MKQLAILAGGKGTRLAAVLGDIPKPMAPVAGKPVIERQIELAQAHGFDQVCIFACYRADLIERHLGDGSRWNLRIKYIVEDEPLGTAGAILAGMDQLADRFVVAYGDTVVNVDLSSMLAAHTNREADATLFVHPNDHPHDSDLVEIDESGWVQAFHPYPHPEGVYYRNLVNAALYVVEKKSIIQFASTLRKSDFGKDLFPAMLKQGRRLLGYRAKAYIKDMGTPDRLARVEQDWSSGLVAERGGSFPSRAVFLDRDGILNEEVNRVTEPGQLRLIPGVESAVRALNRSGFLAIGITNQPVIARGECSEAGLRLIHNKLDSLLGSSGAFLNDLYYCPHHPDKGFPGERPELKRTCECRKPAPGMILQATADWKIDLGQSWFIGDSTADIRAASNAGIRSILVRSGHQGADGKYPGRADYEFFNLNEAVGFVTRDHERMMGKVRELVKGIQPGERIALGGLARCGKSTLASLIREALQEREISAKILSLDNWIIGENQRQGPSVRDRFDYPAITEALKPLFDSAALKILCPRYDRKTRSRHAEPAELAVSPADVLLIDGVVSLDLSIVTQLCQIRIFCSCHEPTRRARFLMDYQCRGWEETAAISLFEERALEEAEIILESRGKATMEIEVTAL